MFTKIDKKILLLAGATLVILIALLGFLGYKFLINKNVEALPVENSQTPVDQNRVDESANAQSSQESVSDTGTEVITESGKGSLTICADWCGDGICQREKETDCSDLNCICPENNQDCPSDCPNN